MKSYYLCIYLLNKSLEEKKKTIRPRSVLGFQGDTSGKEPACQCRWPKRSGFHPWVRKILWRRKWQPTPVFLPEKSHGQRNLAGYSPLSRKELNTTEWLTHTQNTYHQEWTVSYTLWVIMLCQWRFILDLKKKVLFLKTFFDIGV